jgi:diguanylate cyclase (GGDEF)-like protein
MLDPSGDEAQRPASARWWQVAAIALSLALVAVVTELLAGADGRPYTVTPQISGAFTLFDVLGVGMAVRAWRHPTLERRSRRAWGLIALAFLELAVSDVLRAVYAGAAFPSPGDVVRLAVVPVMLAGLLMLPLRAQGSREQGKVWLDVVIVVVASGMLMWYVQIGPSVAQAGRIPGHALAAAIAYPVLDLMLIFGAAVVLFRGAAESARRPAALLGLGMLFIVAGDTYLGYRQSHGGGGPDRWQFACWLSGHFLLMMSAFEQCRRARRHNLRTEESRARSASALPYLAVAGSYVLLVLAVWAEPIRIQGLVAGAVMITGLVVTRQVVALRENHALAITDTLTGLVNRRQLHDRLRLAIARSARDGKIVAVLLLDMNGFKQVNDTMGHEAGDQLLVAFGRILRRNVLGLDVVARLGGDEFAIILHNIDTAGNALSVAERIIADMHAPILIRDTPVQPDAAIGVALSGRVPLTADELLHHADLAMYRAKRAKTSAAELYQDEPGSDPATGTTRGGGTPQAADGR